MAAIGEAIEAAVAYLREHPGEATYTDGPATARLEEGLRVRATGSEAEHVVTDMPASVGGSASAPSPGWLLRAAEATCVATLVAMRAAQLGVRLSDLQVLVDSVSDDRGILGIEATVPAGPLRSRVSVRIGGEDASLEDLDTLARWAVDHCPVTDAVRRAVPIGIEIDVTQRGKEP